MVDQASNAYQIGGFFGALVITFLLTRGVRAIFKNRDDRTRAYLAFIIVFATAMILTSVSMGIGRGFITYTPGLVL